MGMAWRRREEPARHLIEPTGCRAMGECLMGCTDARQQWERAAAAAITAAGRVEWPSSRSCGCCCRPAISYSQPDVCAAAAATARGRDCIGPRAPSLVGAGDGARDGAVARRDYRAAAATEPRRARQPVDDAAECRDAARLRRSSRRRRRGVCCRRLTTLYRRRRRIWSRCRA